MHVSDMHDDLCTVSVGTLILRPTVWSRFLTKDPCAISCGQILMTDVVGAYRQEAQGTLLVKTYLSSSTIQMV